MTEPLKYLADGRIVHVLSTLPDGQFVVELGHDFGDDDDAEPFFEGTQIVKAVYDKPPRDAIDREICRLEERKTALSACVRDLVKQEGDARKRVEALKSYDALKRIEDFLDGKITHYVIWDGYMDEYPAPRVAALKDERSGNEARNPYEELKLLVLYGSKNRSLEWKLSYYSDGSGGDKSHCIPCCSLEEATEKAKAILADSFSRYKWPAGGNTWPAEKLIRSARALGAPIPDGYEERWRQHEIRGFEAEIQKCERERQNWQQRLEVYMAKTAPAA